MGTKSRSSNRACGALAAVMSDIVIHSASQMTDADLSTIADYLKDQPPQSGVSQTSVADEDRLMRAGQAIYVDNCTACHTSAGTGSGRCR
jgi:mono/diheme cytochrome c family protein